MSTVKASSYLRLLDAARCKGEWGPVPELCRKVRKHAPQRTCIALVAETEARLRTLPPPPPSSSPTTVASYAASMNALQDRLQAELKSPDTLKKLPSPAGGGESMVTTSHDILQARTIIAWICLLKREWRPVLDIVPSEEEVGEGWDAEPAPVSDYIGIVRMKALIIRGIALSNCNEDPSSALQAFRAATRIMNTFPLEQRAYVVFLIWSEKALSHYAQTVYRCWLEAHAPTKDTEDSLDVVPEAEDESVGLAIGKTIVDEGTVATAFRRFNSFVTAPERELEAPARLPEQALTPDMHVERMEVYRNYYKFLSTLLNPTGNSDNSSLLERSASLAQPARDNPTVPERDTGEDTPNSKTGSKEQLRQELNDVGKVYEDYLMRGTSFPKADEYHEVIGEWVDLVMENWRITGASGSDAAAVVEILYRGATRTFHSPRILRHLFTTLTAMGNLNEAIPAFTTYLDLIQRGKDRISKGNVEKDFDSDATVIETATEGIRVLCKFTADYEEANKVATKMETWRKKWHLTDPPILTNVYRGIGFANSALAQKTMELKKRREFQKVAMDAFKKSLSYDPYDVQSWYSLAFIEAQMGSVEDATESTRKGLGALHALYEDPDSTEETNQNYVRNVIQFLHLLALLMTANDDFAGAEKVCMDAFAFISEGSEAVSNLGITDKTAVLELKMTHIALMEPIDGPEAVIPMTDDLLSLYGTLFDGTHYVQQMNQPSDESTSASQSIPLRPRTASKASRFLGRGSKTQSPGSPVEAPPIPEKPTSRSGTIKKRPKSGNQSFVDSGLDAPKIQITDTNGGALPAEKSHRKFMRPSSVSGGTIRRMRSLGSMKSSATSLKEGYQDGIATPAMSSATELSNYDSPTASVGGQSIGGRESHLFNTLKTKLHRHHEQGTPDSASESASSTAIGSALTDGATDSVPMRYDSFRDRDIPHNLPRAKVPYPLRSLGRSVSDDTDGRPRSLKRPPQLPEPILAREEERKKVLGVLRKTWLFVAGLYRRAGYLEDCAMAVDEATGLARQDDEGEGDVFTERGLLQLAMRETNIAATLFEAAVAIDYDHPQAIVSLTTLLLDMEPSFLTPLAPPPEPPVDVPGEIPAEIIALTQMDTPVESWDPKFDLPPEGAEEDPPVSVLPAVIPLSEATLDKVAARNRAIGLLEKLVTTGRGWDLAEGWFLLAQALLKAGEIERAKQALWRVVDLEDSNGVRRWGSCARFVM